MNQKYQQDRSSLSQRPRSGSRTGKGKAGQAQKAERDPKEIEDEAIKAIYS